jgi:hypothetical protein
MNTATFIFDGQEEVLPFIDAERRLYAFKMQGYDYILRRSLKKTIYEIYAA